MRDFLSYDPNEFDPAQFDQVLSHPDPVKRAQSSVRKTLPKRFYATASTGARDDGHAILLDGRAVKTPQKNVFALPTSTLAEAVAAEWAAQGEYIDPATMPLTRLANSILDGVRLQREAVADEITRYLGNDLVCYRAESPWALAERQSIAWDPVLDWAEDRYGARFLCTEGIVHVAQDPDAIAAIGRTLDGLSIWQLGALHVMTTLTGSSLLALMVSEGALAPSDAWSRAHIDEDWTIEHWGADAEATARRAFSTTEFEAACHLLNATR
jgi:chaperone required for assembly of F1-ATPase